MSRPLDPPLVHRRWLKRWLIGGVGVVVLMPVLRVAASWKIERELDAIAKEVRDKGGAWTGEDLDARPAIPDAQNAAILYDAAIKLRVDGLEAYRNSNHGFDREAQKPIEWYYVCWASDIRYQEMFALASQAIDRPECRWDVSYANGWTASIAGHLNASRALANELTDNAEYRHAIGDDVTALHRIESILSLGESLRKGPLLIDQMVGSGIDSLGVSALVGMAPSLRVDDARVRAGMLRLMETLDRRDRTVESRVITSLLNECAMLESFVDDGIADAWMMRPAVRRIHGHFARQNLSWDAPQAPLPGNDPVKRKVVNGAGLLPVYDRPPLVGFSVDNELIALTPTADLPLLTIDWPDSRDRYRAMIERFQLDFRFARVLLAMRLFEHDTGRRAADLNELVPKYLPTVPTRPGYDDEPLKLVNYKAAHRDGSDRLMLVADGASDKNDLPPSPCDSWYPYYVPGSEFDEDGRMFRDAAPWPASAYKPQAEATHRIYDSRDDIYDYQPGFEASGLAPSEHSPTPNDHPYIPEAPWE